MQRYVVYVNIQIESETEHDLHLFRFAARRMRQAN